MLRALILFFLALPVLELFVLYRLSGRIGFLETLLLVLFVGFAGASLAKREGLRVFVRWQEAVAEGRTPDESLLSSFLLLVAAGLLVLPGLVSDVLGLLLLLPPFRRLIGNIVRRRFERGIRAGEIHVVGPSGRPAPRAPGGIVDVVGEDVTPPPASRHLPP